MLIGDSEFKVTVSMHGVLSPLWTGDLSWVSLVSEENKTDLQKNVDEQVNLFVTLKLNTLQRRWSKTRLCFIYKEAIYLHHETFKSFIQETDFLWAGRKAKIF